MKKMFEFADQLINSADELMNSSDEQTNSADEWTLKNTNLVGKLSNYFVILYSLLFYN